MDDRLIRNLEIDGQPGKLYAPTILTGLSETEDFATLKEGLSSITEASKNLFNKDDVRYVTGYINNFNYASGSILSNSQARTIYIPCAPNTTYTISKTISKRFYFGYTDQVPEVGCTVPYAINNNANTALTITTGSSAKYLVAFIYLGSADALSFSDICETVQIEVGGSATEYVPYSVTAVDSVARSNLASTEEDLQGISAKIDSVTGNGKNLFDKNNVDYLSAYIAGTHMGSGDIRSNSGARTIFVSCKPNTTYTISKQTTSKRFIVGYTSTIPSIGTTLEYILNDDTKKALTITTSADAHYLVAFVYLSSADTLSFSEICDMLQIEEGSVATSYEPYGITAVDSIARKAVPIVDDMQKQLKATVLSNETIIGDEICGDIANMTPINGSVYENDVWKIPVTGGIRTTVTTEANGVYLIDIGVVFGSQVMPDPDTSTVFVKSMTVTLDTSATTIFAFQDGNFKVALTSLTGGSVTLEIVCNNLSLDIATLSVKPVMSYPDKPLMLNNVSAVVEPVKHSMGFGGGQTKNINTDANTAFGYQAQNDLNTGYANTAVGYAAQNKIQNGRANTAVGNRAQVYLTTGMYNNAMGTASQQSIQGGSWNNAFGNEAQMEITEGCNNTAMGRRAQSYITTGHMNTAIGAFAGFAQHGMGGVQGDHGTKTASYQTLIGGESIQGSTVPQDYATALGYQTQANEKAIAIGAKSKALGENSVAIGFGVTSNNDNELVLGSASQSIVICGKKITFNSDGTVTWTNA